jgi:hypothetical protein
MPPRREVDPNLLSSARRGELSRSNTRPGTPERRAVDRVKYLKRRAAHPEVSARQALGHPKTGDVLPTISLMVTDPPRFLIIEALNRRDLRRAGRYDNLVNQLYEGRITSASFERRVRGWRPIAEYTFLSDPDAVLAILEERRAADLEVFHYESGRAP